MSANVDCGCTDYGLSRRSLLKTAGALSVAGIASSMIGDVLTSTVYGATNGNVLVVLSLRGGADGLSMVVPHAEKAYAEARPGTALKPSSLLQADPTFGLHPGFAALSKRWSAGQFAALHAVGLPAPNRSHFDAMESLEDADPGSESRIGWINRMISALEPTPDVLHAMNLGTTTTPTSLVGPRATVSAIDLDEMTLPMSTDAVAGQALSDLIRQTYSLSDPVMASAGTSAVALSKRAKTITSNLDRSSRGVYAKNSDAGSALKLSAQLIRSGVGVRAIAIDAGGWDHHAGLAWNVDNKIKELAANLDAFFTDLGSHADRVTVVTLSEFGRRLTQNGAGGVDHGYGNCVLALGAGVRGGRYYSRWPGLDIDDQVDGDLAVTTDYRSVLSEILADRFPEVNLSQVFPGVSMQPLGFMGSKQLIPGVV